MDRTRWLVLPLVALALAACGSSGSSDNGASGSSDKGASGSPPKGASGSPDKLSKADLIAKADKICQDVKKRQRTIAKPASVKDYPAVQMFAEESASVADEAVGKLKELTPPDSVKSDYDAWVKAGEGQVEEYRKLADAGKAKSTAKVRAALANFRRLGADARKVAGRVGFKGGRCGSGGS